MTDWKDRIAVDPGTLVGKPIVRGTRISVELLLVPLGNGWTMEQNPRILPSANAGRLEASLKQMADTAMGPADLLGVDAIELAHPQRQVGVRCLHHQVIGHQAVGMADPAEALAGRRQNAEKRRAVVVEVAEKEFRRSLPWAVIW